MKYKIIQHANKNLIDYKMGSLVSRTYMRRRLSVINVKISPVINSVDHKALKMYLENKAKKRKRDFG